MTLHCFINHFIVVIIILRLQCTKSDFRWDWDPYPGKTQDQCRWNDFEIGGGGMSGAKHRKKFKSWPSPFVALQVQYVV